VCGFGSIAFAAQWAGYNRESSLFAAGCLIFLAMVFDAFDGAAARWAKQTTEFGAQLDSLCDAISFGAAPALLMLQFAQPVGYHPRVLWTAGAVYVACVVLRLARYNVNIGDPTRPKGFTGLPSPAAAGVVASFPMMTFGPALLDTEGGQAGERVGEWIDWAAVRVLPVVAVAVAGLMVSRVHYSRHFLARGRRSAPALVRLIFMVAVIVAVPRVAAPLLTCWYAFATPLRAAWVRHIVPWFTGRPPADDLAPPRPPHFAPGKKTVRADDPHRPAPPEGPVAG
jgi:CDP-diacylglycerol--serine O-phosphatidyltransferase